MIVDLPKKALVTGGAGFLGAHLCRRLLSEGYEVTCLDNLFTGMKTNIDDPKKRKQGITLARELMNGWEPKVSLDVGILKTIGYFRERFA